MKNGLVKCTWKIILDKNLEGQGTSFVDTSRRELFCYDCDGFNDKCENYSYLNKYKEKNQ